MKVQFEKTVEVQGEVSISTEQIRYALHEAFSNASPDEDGDRIYRSGVGELISAAWQVLSAMPDEMIAALSPQMRTLVADKLAEQVKRYAV